MLLPIIRISCIEESLHRKASDMYSILVGCLFAIKVFVVLNIEECHVVLLLPCQKLLPLHLHPFLRASSSPSKFFVRRHKPLTLAGAITSDTDYDIDERAKRWRTLPLRKQKIRGVSNVSKVNCQSFRLLLSQCC